MNTTSTFPDEVGDTTYSSIVDEVEPEFKLDVIYSGCQDGIDILALQIAKELGYKTGGFAPSKFYTKTGNHSEYAELYNVKELKFGTYKQRTHKNVEKTDATILIIKYINSPGTICALKAIEKYNKPYFIINVDFLDGMVDKCVEWVKEGKYTIINFAGHSNDTCKGITEIAAPIIKEILSKCQKTSP